MITAFMPEPLSAADTGALIDAAIAAVGASGMRDMGKVMAHLKGDLQGRADMGAVSATVRAKLA